MSEQTQINLESEAELKDTSLPVQVSKEPKQKTQKQILVNCKKFQYLGIEPYKFKDSYGHPYIAQPNQILIVPNDSLARHFKYKKLYFKEL